MNKVEKSKTPEAKKEADRQMLLVVKELQQRVETLENKMNQVLPVSHNKIDDNVIRRKT